ncbi:MAG: DUF192 domain-containing protein [Patescibacteria group bacterium]
MKKKLFFFVLTALLLLVFFLFFQNKSQTSRIQDHQKISILIGEEIELEVEVVNTPESITQGLSGREGIDIHSTGSTKGGQAGQIDGMLFIFPQRHIPKFWMKDMKFDLDFVWIDNGLVVDLTESVSMPEPGMKLQDLPTYSPKSQVNMVLELPGGAINQYGIMMRHIVGLKP